MGQVMRLHCVVPEGVIIQLDPRVTPGTEGTPTFMPTNTGPITLPHEGWWILRFPYPFKTPFLWYLLCAFDKMFCFLV